MAYFAQLDENNIVLQVISIDNAIAQDPAPSNSEPLGQDFIAKVLGFSGKWKQTSYHRNFRKQYAGPGFRYDAEADVFIAPQPYPSWSLDENHDWQPPVPRPSNPGIWSWDEETASWIEIGESL